jgi:membrane associated rhomboid family serine protease
MIPIRDDNPTERPAYVTVALIILCALAFLWQQSHPLAGQEQIAYSLGLVPAVLFDLQQLPPQIALVPAELTIFTSMFLHGGWLHLIGNMLYLWIFGNNVEDAMGRVRFVLFYLLCGVAAALAQALPNPDSVIPMIGASGAVAGVLGAYLLLHPRAQVTVVIPLGFLLYPVQWPAVLVLGLWFAIQIGSSLMVTGDEGGVAWFAHVGGFVAGMALIPLFKRRDVPLWRRAGYRGR